MPPAAATAGGRERSGRSVRARRRSTPSSRSSCSASSRARFVRRTARKRRPNSSGQASVGGSRPARTIRTLSSRAGTNVWRSHGSSGRTSSYRSSARTTRSPSDASRATARSTSASTSPVAAESPPRKPRTVGSIAPPSSSTATDPRSRASIRKDSSSLVLPTPPMPWTSTTSGWTSSSIWRRTSRSGSRPTRPEVRRSVTNPGDSRRGGEPVAKAADGLDRRRAVPEFASQRLHERLDDVAAAGVVVAPHVAQQDARSTTAPGRS